MSSHYQNYFERPEDVKDFFNTDEKCLDFLRWLRWNNKPTCTHCRRETNTGWIDSIQKWKCYRCRKTFTITSGSIFQSYTKGMLPIWFHMLAFTVKHGVTADVMADVINVKEKETAHKMQAKFRYALIDVSKDHKLEGIVEVDESYYGGEPHRNFRLRKEIWRYKNEQRKKGKKATTASFGHKIGVLGLTERDTKDRPGRRVYILLEQGKKGIMKYLQEYIDPSATVMTDDAPLYNSAKKHFNKHYVIRHKIRSKELDPDTGKQGKLYVRKKLVDGEILIITTNHIENDWLHSKIDYRKRYHVTHEHLLGYVFESGWRRKKDVNRDTFNDKFLEAMRIACSGHISYEKIKKFTRIEIEDSEDSEDSQGSQEGEEPRRKYKRVKRKKD